MKKFIYILALLLCSACQDHDMPNAGGNGDDLAIAAYRQKQTVVSRAEAEHVEVDGKIRFLEGTYYWIWGYRNIDGTTSPNNGVGQFFVRDKDTEDAFYTRGVESPSHYVELSPANKQKLNKTMHLYGVTDNTAEFNTILPQYTVVDNRPVFNLTKTDDLPDWDYHDICRGYIYYDPNAEEFINKSSFDLPFSHVMSQIKISVIQEGQIKSTESSENGVVIEGKEAYDIYLKSIKLYNELPTAKYEAIGNTYDYTGVERTTLEQKREIWSNTENKGLGRKIPLVIDDNTDTNIEAIDLIVPQRKDCDTSPSNTAYNFEADWEPDNSEPGYGDAVWLELVISGSEAFKFDNEYQSSVKNNDEVTIWLPIKDFTGESNEPLNFLPNHAYNIVVIFHGDDVHVVTIKPLLYPWFDGESEGEVAGDKYQTTDIGSPMVFGNVQWNDRYMGSDWVAPTNLNEFVKATGFYYQKDRSIPFYPTKYVGGYVYDLEGKIHDLDWAADNVGESHTKTVEDETYKDYYNRTGSGVQDIWADRTTMTRTYTIGGQVMFRAGGHWVDPTPAQMMNDLPVVHPVVSYYLPDEQIEIPGLDTPGDDSYIAYVEDYHAYGTSGKYCCTVDDYYDRETGVINTYKDKQGDFSGNLIMRYVSDMRDVTNNTWADVNKHPCPPGWRLPTKEELFTIFPSTPVAGNLTFLRQFGIHDGSIGNNDGSNKNDSLPCKEVYLRIPMDKPETDMYPLPSAYASGNEALITNRSDQGFNVHFPAYDPEPDDVTQYVISKRHFDATEYDALDNKIQSLISKEEYTGFHNYHDSPINPPEGQDGHHATYVDREWGTIYAIKKQGTVDAYRMRWRVERVQENYDIYQIVVDKYKCDQFDRLEYDIEKINSNYYYMRYDWDHPESTLYFPVTGIIADHDMSQYNKITVHNDVENKDEDKRLGGPRLYNYGTETIILTSSYTNYNFNNVNKRYAAAYRIKITGTDCYSMYLYPSMERLAQGGQVRPVRTAR